MAKYVLEWRQPGGRATRPFFVHRLAYAAGAGAARQIAEGLGDRAWHREFRVARGGLEVFTDLHAIQDWRVDEAALPLPSRHHIWHRDLRTDLAADRFVVALADVTGSAVAAGVLLRADADTLVRFARGSLRRPRL